MVSALRTTPRAPGSQRSIRAVGDRHQAASVSRVVACRRLWGTPHPRPMYVLASLPSTAGACPCDSRLAGAGIDRGGQSGHSASPAPGSQRRLSSGGGRAAARRGGPQLPTEPGQVRGRGPSYAGRPGLQVHRVVVDQPQPGARDPVDEPDLGHAAGSHAMAEGVLRRVRARRCALGRRCTTPAHNMSWRSLDLNADAIAYAVLQYAMNTQAVNGEKGQGNFKPEAAAASPGRLGPCSFAERSNTRAARQWVARQQTAAP